MPAPGDHRPSSFEANPPAVGPTPPAPRDATATEHRSLLRRVAPVAFILGAIAAAIVVALGTRGGESSATASAKVGAQQAAAARQMAANRQWASATCSTVLGWKNEMQRDTQGLGLSLSAIPRVQDAIGATTRMVGSIEGRGLPPALRSAQGRAAVEQLRSDLQSHVQRVQSAASAVAGGNLAAIGTLLNELGNVPSMGRQIAGDLRQVASELGVSLASSPSCQQLAGLKLST